MSICYMCIIVAPSAWLSKFSYYTLLQSPSLKQNLQNGSASALLTSGVFCCWSMSVKCLLLCSPLSLCNNVCLVVNHLADSVHYLIKDLRSVCMNMVPCPTDKVHIHKRVGSSWEEPLSWRAVHPRPSAINERHWNIWTQLVNSLQHGPLGKPQRKLHVWKSTLATGRGKWYTVWQNQVTHTCSYLRWVLSIAVVHIIHKWRAKFILQVWTESFHQIRS